MRIRSFAIRNAGPILRLEASNLSDVVVLAGPNGVGKTRVNQELLRLGRDPQVNADLWAQIEPTNLAEASQWKKEVLDTSDRSDCNLLRATLHRNQRRNKYQSSFLNFDSDRTIRNVQSFNFGWDIGDPYSEDISWDLGLNPMFNRYNDVRHSLFRLVEAQKRQISEQAFSLKSAGQSEMKLDFPDVLAPFKAAFWQLLAPKQLIEVDVRNQQIVYEHRGQRFPLETLSSGEREVVNIVFDFILRNPEHCIVVFDEPELHLHPELTYKLLQTLSTVGKRNQFILSTHSPDIISASLENTVLFITPPKDPSQNQALLVRQDDETHYALKALGQSVGVISLGRKLVLIEGDESSLDKQTYGSILRNRFPEFVLVPAGGKSTIRSFEEVQHSVLNRTIWGVDFFLLCDRDAENALGRLSTSSAIGSRIRALPRYHLENYFLDEEGLAQAFEAIEPQNSWLRNPVAIRAKLREIAHSLISYTVALNVSASVRTQVGNVSIMPKGAADAKCAEELLALISGKAAAEAERISLGLQPAAIKQLVEAEFLRLSNAVNSDVEIWKRDIPGRVVLNKFAASAQIQSGRLKQLYLSRTDIEKTFSDVIAIFEGFRAQGNGAQ